MTYPTYSIRVKAGNDAQDLIDQLNKPRSYSEDYPDDGTNELGLGPNTTPKEQTDLPGLSKSNAQPDDTAQERWITLWVRPRDVERFENIIANVQSAKAKRWHPEGKTDAAHDTVPPFQNPGEHPAQDNLERIPPQAQEANPNI